MNQIITTDPRTDPSLIEADRENLVALVVEVEQTLASKNPLLIMERIGAYGELVDALKASIANLDDLGIELVEDDARDDEVEAVQLLRQSQVTMRRYTEEIRDALNSSLKKPKSSSKRHKVKTAE